MSEIKKPSTRTLIPGSLVIVIFLAIDGKPGNEIAGIIVFLAILVMAYCVIQMWIRYIKEYVEFTMEHKFKSDDKEIGNQ